jgi:hypothetical protein
MKKIIFLLLVTISSYSQTLQNPTFGNVKIKQNVNSTTYTKVNVQESDGTVNTISKSDLIDAIFVDNATQLTTSIGNINKLYVTKDNNIIYRYNGTIYVTLSADVSGKEDIINKSSSFTASSTVTYANTKALVDGLATKANDADVVKLTGSQTISGQKQFNSAVGISSNSYSSSGLLNLQGNSTFPVLLAANGGSGKTITTSVTNGVGFSSNVTSGNNGLNFEGQNNSVNTFTVNKTGDIVGNTYTGGATLTGTPTAPTPTTTTGIANKSYVDGLDAGNVKLSTVQTISGVKTFSGATLQANAITATSFTSSTAPAGNVLLAGGGTLANPITGTGITNFLPKFTGTGTVGNSIISDDGTTVMISKTGATTLNIQTNTSGNPSLNLIAGGSDASTIVYDRATSELRISNSGATNAFRLNSAGAATFSSTVTAGGNILSGVSSISNWSQSAAIARFGHQNFNTLGNYGFLQASDGVVFLAGPSVNITGPTVFSSTVTASALNVSDSNSYAFGSGSVKVLGNSGANVLDIQTSNTSALFINALRQATFSSTVTASNFNSTLGSNFATTSGNVGIGTATPNAKTHIKGGSQSNSITDVSTTGSLRIDTANPAVTAVFGYDASDNVFLQSVNSSTNVSKPLLINPFGGNTLIGTTADNGSKLQVAGAATFSSTVTASNGTALNHLITKAQTLYNSQAITANKTVTISEFTNNEELIISVNATAGNVTVTLPAFASLQGYKVTVKKMDSSANSVIITGVSAINIDGASTLVVSGQYGKATIGANSTQYIIL